MHRPILLGTLLLSVGASCGGELPWTHETSSEGTPDKDDQAGGDPSDDSELDGEGDGGDEGGEGDDGDAGDEGGTGDEADAGDEGGTSDEADTGGGGDTGDEGGTDGGGGTDGDDTENAKTFPRSCSDLYAQDLLPTFVVEVPEAEWQGLVEEFTNWEERAALGLEEKPYHPIVFRYGDEVVLDAAIRLKGNPCCSWRPPKMQFVISFNEVRRKGRFHGLRKIALDAPPYDPSMLRERLALATMRDLGLPAPCANNARLIVNGRYYGLFVNVEYVDKEFLERNFANPEGDLYKEGRRLKTNEETADPSRMHAFWAATDVGTLESLADLEQMLAHWAAEAVLPDRDGFWAGSINFYLYDVPQRGFVMIPWDLDLTFSTIDHDADPVTYVAAWGEKPRPFTVVLADPVWRGRYREAVARALDRYQPHVLRERFDRWRVQIEPAIAADPNLPFTHEHREDDLRSMTDYFERRAEFVRDWLSAEPPASP